MARAGCLSVPLGATWVPKLSFNETQEVLTQDTEVWHARGGNEAFGTMLGGLWWEAGCRWRPSIMGLTHEHEGGSHG